MRRHQSRTTPPSRPLAIAVVCGLLLAACGDVSLPLPDELEELAEDEVTPAGDAADEVPEVAEEVSDDLVVPDSDADAPLALLSIEPGSGPTTGAVQVILTGTGFIPGMTVLFGQAPALDSFVLDPGTLAATAPPHPSGAVDVSVFHPAIDEGAPVVLESAFVYEAAVEITGVAPSSGHVSGGELVTVTGTGFDATARFFLGGKAAINQVVVSATSLSGVAPPGSWGATDVQVVSEAGSAIAHDAWFYGRAPRVDLLAPISGPPTGGTRVELHGVGLAADAVVTFDGWPAELLEVADDGTAAAVTAPPGPAGGVADVSVATSWGLAMATGAWSWQDPATDPYLLACSHAFPTAGPAEGGTVVTLSCAGLHYGAEVTLGGAAAEVLGADAESEQLVFVAPAGAPGPADVVVTTPFATVTLEDGWTWSSPAALTIDAVTPSIGAPEGGTAVTLDTTGLADDAVVYVGALPAVVTSFDPATGAVEVLTPPGSPGAVDVRLLSGGHEATAAAAFTYTTGTLSLDLVTPATAAQAGGTWVALHGDGFVPGVTVTIGEVVAEIADHPSEAELWVLSPKLTVGTWDVRVEGPTGEVVMAEALTVYDPRSGYGGTWGGPIDGAVNVTVRGNQGYGPIAGAFVVAERPDGSGLTGYTDENGQVTLSVPGLAGPVDVTAGAPGWTSYSIVHFDATNVTVYLKSTVPISTGGGSGGGVEPPPNATLRGKVLGLGKYVVPPPGSCNSAIVGAEGGLHCTTCTPEIGCAEDGFACVDLLEQGHRCLATGCETSEACADGYVCGVIDNAPTCMPNPGTPMARCGVSNTSVFTQNLIIPPLGVVGPDDTYELPSTRLGDIAIVCLGGFLDPFGVFTPTALGVRRHVIATSAAVLEGLDVTLAHPLKEHFRLRMMDPPTWPDGLASPTVVISLDLGSDGAIPFTRTPLPRDGLLISPRQLAELTGDLYDAKYFLYTIQPSMSPTGLPTTYNLVQDVKRVVEDRLPVFTEGAWTLEPSEMRHDLYALWGTASDRLFAVGDEGRLLRFDGNAWTAQSTPTDAPLRAVTGRHDTDVYAAGDDGELIHYGGLGWQLLDAPADAYRALATAPGEALYAAGTSRLRRLDLDGWAIEGPPWVQDVHGLAVSETGALAAVGGDGRVMLRAAPGAGWALLDSPVTQTLRAVATDGTRLVAVGDGGAVVHGLLDYGVLEAVTLPGLDDDLTSVTLAADGSVFAVGNDGAAVRQTPDGAWHVDLLFDYHARATAVFAPPDGGPVRVVGTTSFVLGPMMGYPILPAPELVDGRFQLAWSWETGPDHQYAKIVLSEDIGKELWTLIVDGDETSTLTPDLATLAGLTGLGSGGRRFEVTRVLNVDFDIDDYTTREFSIWKRTSWSLHRVPFTAP